MDDWECWGAVRILVSRARGDPRSALERGLRPRERGPERGGSPGSRRFREISGFPSPGTRPLHPETLLGGAAPVRARAWGVGVGGGRRHLGCCSSRGGFFFPFARLPAFIFALLQAVRGRQTQTRSFLTVLRPLWRIISSRM